MRDTRRCLASVRTVQCVASGDLLLRVVSRILFSTSAVSVPARSVPRRLRCQRLYSAGAKRCAGSDHRRARKAELFGDRVIRNPFLGQQNHPAFLGHSLWRCSGADQRFQLRSGGAINGKSRGGRKHDPIESWRVYIVNSYGGRDTSTESLLASRARLSRVDNLLARNDQLVVPRVGLRIYFGRVFIRHVGKQPDFTELRTVS